MLARNGEVGDTADMSVMEISPPMSEEQARSLKIGQEVHISGTIYAARDAAKVSAMSVITPKTRSPSRSITCTDNALGPLRSAKWS